MSDFTDFNTHTITVETLTGSGGMGDTFAASRTVEGVQVDDARKLVRDMSAREVVCETTIFDDDTTRAGIYTPGSKVTLPSGRVAAVISVKTLDALGVDLPAHVEVNLT